MRMIPVMALAGLLAFAGVVQARSPQATAQHAATKTAETPPLTRLPDWAAPESYDLALKSDPDQPGYSGTVTIAVNLKKASNHLWLHGKDLQVSRVTITDANGKTHAGKYDAAVSKAAERAGVARVDFGTTLKPQKLQLKFVFTAPYNQTLQGYYKVTFAGNAYLQTQMEPISARLAFPCFDQPGFKVPMTLSLTIPDADKAVANTAETKSTPAGKGWKTITFAPTKPLPTYLYAWLVGPWDIVVMPISAAAVRAPSRSASLACCAANASSA